MAGLDDLSRGELKDILRRLRTLETASPLQNASIGSNGLRVYDGGVITIQNGGLSVTGTASITGTLQADGTVAFTGTFTQSGPTTFTGDTKLNGPTHINGTTDIAGNVTATGTFTNNGPTNLNGPTKTTGTLSVEGVTTLKNDLNVTTGGKVKVGSAMTLDPSVSSGALVFSNGAQVFTDATTIQMFKGTSAVQVANGTATLQGNGSNYMRSDSAAGNTIAGPLKNTFHSTISGVAANVYMDPVTGAIKRIV
ncbi:hypothetical protein [Arthrobacter sp. I3]|uniref:hypothetical protein n=1 Tax=Arthrobacter sp. I3 TaxID=218158 RepID=UPI000488CAE0|nr:hypothetical protein [Arthrobacter sp. I3]